MSTTTQILFNSPALHSLKREQLIKLCKIHSIKATGKNVELVEKLKQHALTLPRDAPLSIAARSEFAPFVPHVDEPFESDNQPQPFYERTRPSEQWEVVMDSIEEMEEASSAQGSLNSLKTVRKDKPAGEFGTGCSKSSVSSSLKTFATSLGLKRTGVLNSSPKFHLSMSTIAPEFAATDELAQPGTPYSQLPPASSMPQPDPFFYDTHGRRPIPIADADIETPVPGQALRPGVPAPLNARLSLGLGLTERPTPSKEPQPTTTIRLISNQCSDEPLGSASPIPQLTPFKTAFELIMSPRMASGIGFGMTNSAITWSSESTIYPALPSETNGLSACAKLPDSADADGDVSMPGALSSPYLQSSPVINVTGDVMMASPPPVPLASGALGSDTLKPLSQPFVFGSPLPKHRVSDAQFREAAVNVLDEMNRRLQAEGVNPVDSGIINRLHPRVSTGGLQTTEGLPTSNAGKRQNKEIAQMFERRHQAEFNKMEGIDTLAKRRAMTANKTDGYAQKEEIDYKPPVGKKRKSAVFIDEPRRVPSQVASRTSGTRVISNGRRSKMMPGAFNSEDLDEEADADEERGKKRAKVDGKGAGVHDAILEEQRKKEKEREAIRRKLEINKAKRKSGAAAARQNGRVSIERVQQKQKPSRFGFLAQAKSIVQSVFGRSKPATAGPSTVTAPTASSRAKVGKPQELDQKTPKVVPSLEAGFGTTGSRGLTGSRTGINHEKEQSINAARSRSPIPSFSDENLIGSRLKKSSAPASTAISRDNSTFSDISSAGRSLGSRGPLTNGSPASSLGVGRSSSSSRLYAPTASSLAKMNGRISTDTSGPKEPSSDGKQASSTPTDTKQHALSSITNNPLHDSIATSRAQSPSTAGMVSGNSLKTAPFPTGSAASAENDCNTDIHLESNATKPPLQRQGTLSGRKPRISRSKVISRLASQRANAVKNSGIPSAGVSRASPTGKTRIPVRRIRSSLITSPNKPIGSRSSHSGLRVNSGKNDLLMSAKKRARQSEYYARRRSRPEVKPDKT